MSVNSFYITHHNRCFGVFIWCGWWAALYFRLFSFTFIHSKSFVVVVICIFLFIVAAFFAVFTCLLCKSSNSFDFFALHVTEFKIWVQSSYTSYTKFTEKNHPNVNYHFFSAVVGVGFFSLAPFNFVGVYELIPFSKKLSNLENRALFHWLCTADTMQYTIFAFVTRVFLCVCFFFVSI